MSTEASRTTRLAIVLATFLALFALDGAVQTHGAAGWWALGLGLLYAIVECLHTQHAAAAAKAAGDVVKEQSKLDLQMKQVAALTTLVGQLSSDARNEFRKVEIKTGDSATTYEINVAESAAYEDRTASAPTSHSRPPH
jgi:hypothetical protein